MILKNYHCRFSLLKKLILAAGLLQCSLYAKEIDGTFLLRHTGVNNVYTQTQTPRMELTDLTAGKFTYQVMDIYKNKTIAAGEVGPEQPVIELPPQKNGYYWVQLNSPEHNIRGVSSFCVVVDPDQRNNNPEMFYAVDSAQSWLAAPDNINPLLTSERFDQTAELTRLAGITSVRERLMWTATEPKATEYNFWHYLQSSQSLSKRNIQILDMFSDSPAWSRTRSKLLPDDLAALYDYSKKAASEFGGQVQYWEFWNEQDLLNSVSEGAWDYASALKAAAYGFKKGNPQVKVLNGGFSLLPLINFDRLILENDALQYIDIFNFHTYKPLDMYPALYRSIEATLADFGRPDMPVWITESGTNVEGVGTVDCFIPGVKSHSYSQEMHHGEFLTKSNIVLQSQGFQRNFTFVFPPYSERNGAKDWGILRRDFTAKPAFAALATLTAQLGNAEYLGTYPTDNPLVAGYVYAQADGSKSLVLWHKSEMDSEEFRSQAEGTQNITVKGLDKAEIIDCWGRGIDNPAADAIAVTRYPLYIKHLDSATFVATKIKKEDKHFEGQFDPGVVCKVIPGEEFTLSNGRDFVRLDAPSGKLTLQIWNLDDVQKSGGITVSGGSLTNIPEKIVLPPKGKIEISGVYTPRGNVGKDLNYKFTVNGKFDNRKISRLVMPVRYTAAISKFTSERPIDGVMNPENWELRSSGKLDVVRDHDYLQFSVTYPPQVDRWVYPVIKKNLIDPAQDAMGITFEIRAVSADIGVSDVYVMVDNDSSQWISYPVPTREWVKQTIVFERPLGKDVRGIAIGMNPRSDNFVYQLKNIKWVYPQKK